MSIPPPLFHCENVGMSFGARCVLRDVSLSVRPGDVLGVVGPNGAGKTTLFEILSGRLQPSQGKVFLKGQNITALPLYERARLGVARTYQSPVVPELLSVGEVFRAARQAYRPFLTAHDAEWAAHQVGLTVPWSVPAAALGALDRRRLLLACLLMRKPQVLLMEHRLELLAALAHRVVVLDAGELIAEGDPERVFDDPRVRAAYFESEAEAAHG